MMNQSVYMPVDCLQNLLSFEMPLEIWTHRLVSSDWHRAVPVALAGVTHATFENRESDYVRRIVDLCPGLKIADGRFFQEDFYGLIAHVNKKTQNVLFVSNFYFSFVLFFNELFDYVFSWSFLFLYFKNIKEFMLLRMPCNVMEGIKTKAKSPRKKNGTNKKTKQRIFRFS